ncbi:hypothetical protein Smp_170680 [Schistosoma mansoni]|uniref:hypothetical protein n=1 Tax=Schistosoma mansoni TaxID=6183 RepID=UPI0001A62E80|nr:hypothetical protein Smp_170680 [Schistosoma mansoni]|eukprot:XP_018652489.1 hypothetical protein Smp_170680 [Schistosoma mansoni]
MSTLKLEDPTVDVGDIEKYRMAFLMQFFVQHKRRFRFPRLRLQVTYYVSKSKLRNTLNVPGIMISFIQN